MKTVSFRDAIVALRRADIVLRCNDGDDADDYTVASYVGWEDEHDEASDFIIQSETWAYALRLPNSAPVAFDENVIQLPDEGVELRLFIKMPTGKKDQA